MTPTNQTLQSKPTVSEQISLLSRQARSDEMNGKLTEAHEGYAAILELDPAIAQAHYQLGRLSYRLRRYAESAASLEKAAKLRPGEAAVWELWTKAISRVGDPAGVQRVRHMLATAPIPDPARAACEKTLSEERSVPGLGSVPPDQLNQALTALRSGDLTRAVDIAEALHAAHPNVAPVALVLGSALSAQGQSEQAETAFAAAIQSAPDYAEAHHGLGRMLLARGRLSEGLAALEKAAALAPDLRAAQVTLARCLIQVERDLPRATTILRKLLRKHPDAPDVLLELGRSYVTERKMRRAIDTLDQVVASGDRKFMVDARVLLAQAYADLGMLDNALAETRDALLDNPGSGSAYLMQARIHLARGDKPASQECLTHALEKLPHFGEAYRLLAATRVFQADDPFIARMQTLWSDVSLPEKDRGNLGFALGKALDDIGAHRAAFPYFQSANAIERKRFPFNQAQFEKQCAEIISAYQNTDFQVAETAKSPGPIFVLGLPRSGAGTVEAILGSHPSVTVGGEVGFVRNEVFRVARGPDGRMRDWSKLKPIAMEAAFDAIKARKQAMFPKAAIVTDRCSIGHMLIGPTLATIPGAKIVVVNRDPRDLALGLYQNKFTDGRHAYSYDLGHLGAHCQWFADLISFWKERLPGQFHEVDYDTLCAEPDRVSREVLTACGLDVPENWSVSVPKLSNGWQRYSRELGPLFTSLSASAEPVFPVSHGT